MVLRTFTHMYGGQQLCKFIETKETVYVTKKSKTLRTGLGQQYGGRDVMGKHSIAVIYFHDGRLLWLLLPQRSKLSSLGHRET